MTDEARRARAAFVLRDAGGIVTQQGEGEALIDDDGLTVGPMRVEFLDADALRSGDYRIELDLWPEGRLALSQLGRRFDTFGRELSRARNRARVAGLLAHGVTPPETFPGALLGAATPQPAEFQVYDTHVTVVPDDADPWQVPFGSLAAVRVQEEPPSVALESGPTPVIVGLLARRRDEFRRIVMERLGRQSSLLAEITGQRGFADGLGIPRDRIGGFDRLLERCAAPERMPCASTLLASATDAPRLGFVQLLDPDAAGPRSPTPLPEPWAAFLLVPAGGLTVFEILAGPGAATYVFRNGIDVVNRDLQALHFRRAALALAPAQAAPAPGNPYRLALRRLEPLARLRASMTARLVHDEGWATGVARVVGVEE